MSSKFREAKAHWIEWTKKKDLKDEHNWDRQARPYEKRQRRESEIEEQEREEKEKEKNPQDHTGERFL